MKALAISKAAAKALALRLLELQSLMTSTINERAELLEQVPQAEQADQEALLKPGGVGGSLDRLNEQIAGCDRRIEAIQATIGKDRHSPELGKLARNLWDAAHAAHASLTPLWPGLLEELREAARAYLEKVKMLGSLAREIGRQETLLNHAARPYVPGMSFFNIFPTGINAPAFQGPVFIDALIAAAYNPGNRPYTAADAIAALHPEAETILSVLLEDAGLMIEDKGPEPEEAPAPSDTNECFGPDTFEPGYFYRPIQDRPKPAQKAKTRRVK